MGSEVRGQKSEDIKIRDQRSEVSRCVGGWRSASLEVGGKDVRAESGDL